MGSGVAVPECRHPNRHLNPEHFDAIMKEAAMYNAAREAVE